MRRPILAFIIATSIILFVWWYADFTDRIRPEPIKVVETDAGGRYDVRISCTFDCEGTAFGSSLKVMFRDRVLYDAKTQFIPAGKTITVRDVPDIKVGKNEFFVYAQPKEVIGEFGAESSEAAGGAFSLDGPPADNPQQSKPTEASINDVARALRIEILHDGYSIADEQFWASRRGPLGEPVRIQVGDDSHEH